MKIKRIYDMIREMMDKMNKDYVSVFAAQAAFFLFLAFFPFVMFLLTLVQYIPMQENLLIDAFIEMIPNAFLPYIESIINEVYRNATTTITSITAVTALWSASKGFLGIVRGLNSVCDIEETRNYIKLRLISALYTLVFAILIIITLVILVFGNQLYYWFAHWYPPLANVALVIISARAVASLVILTVFFLLMFVVIPNRKTKFLRELPGAIVAAAGWLSFSFAYSFYIDHMGGFSSTYGSLTAITLLMLWTYFCMYILFIGAELNVFLNEKGGFKTWFRRFINDN